MNKNDLDLNIDISDELEETQCILKTEVLKELFLIHYNDPLVNLPRIELVRMQSLPTQLHQTNHIQFHDKALIYMNVVANSTTGAHQLQQDNRKLKVGFYM